jgi:hypothetical protein
MPRYVVLEHDHPFLHWDLMLETGDVLRTWRLADPPQPGQETAATALGNHRRFYLDHQGPVSQNRGCVVRWDAGSFTWMTDESSLVCVCLLGRRLQGRAVLTQIEGDKWSFSLLHA